MRTEEDRLARGVAARAARDEIAGSVDLRLQAEYATRVTPPCAFLPKAASAPSRSLRRAPLTRRGDEANARDRRSSWRGKRAAIPVVLRNARASRRDMRENRSCSLTELGPVKVGGRQTCDGTCETASPLRRVPADESRATVSPKRSCRAKWSSSLGLAQPSW